MKLTLLLAAFCAVLPSTLSAQGPGNGRGPGGGGMAFQEAIHKLFENHTKIKRTVEMTETGYKARTVSDDPEIARTLQKHVKEMRERLGAGMMIRRWDPAFAELVEHYPDLGHEFKEVDGGVEMITTGKTPEAVKIAQNHARIVSGFAEKGMEQMHATHPRALDADTPAEGAAPAAAGCPECQKADAARPAEAACPDCKKEATAPAAEAKCPACLKDGAATDKKELAPAPAADAKCPACLKEGAAADKKDPAPAAPAADTTKP